MKGSQKPKKTGKKPAQKSPQGATVGEARGRQDVAVARRVRLGGSRSVTRATLR